MRLSSVAIAAALFLSAASVADAATLHFTTTLKGSDEVPANTTAGKGQVTATLDTTSRAFNYDVTYSGSIPAKVRNAT